MQQLNIARGVLPNMVEQINHIPYNGAPLSYTLKVEGPRAEFEFSDDVTGNFIRKLLDRAWKQKKRDDSLREERFGIKKKTRN